MLLIVGLGNPEKKYENTRHNIGFLVLDQLAKQLDLTFEQSKFAKAMFAKNDAVELIKPLTYVNNSGESVNYVKNKHEIGDEKIWVIHDDVELPFGTVRVKFAGGDGGHNGIKSIDEYISPNYWRIKIGVGRDKDFGELADYVLAPFSSDEAQLLPGIIDRVVSYLLKSISERKLETITFNAKEK